MGGFVKLVVERFTTFFFDRWYSIFPGRGAPFGFGGSLDEQVKRRPGTWASGLRSLDGGGGESSPLYKCLIEHEVLPRLEDLKWCSGGACERDYERAPWDISTNAVKDRRL